MSDSDRWRGFSFRPGDIVISTPPKCGTTWVQMICALLVLQEPVLPLPLSVLSPWVDYQARARRDVLADLEAQTHRRFIKTHTPLPGLPLDPTVTYVFVGRDPRDAALSMANHQNNSDYAKFAAARAAAAGIDGVDDVDNVHPATFAGARAGSDRERFWRWVDDDAPPTEVGSSLLRLVHHAGTFADAAGADVVMLHFQDLRADLEGQMRALADRLDIEVPARRWPELVAAATFAAMRDQSTVTAPDAHLGFWRDNERFFNKGTSGQWRDLLDDDDQQRYRMRANAVGPAAVVEWLHRGPP